MNSHQKYMTFGVQDFIMDENFQRFVNTPTERDLLYWQELMNKYPEKRSIINEAQTLVKVLSTNKIEEVGSITSDIWKNLSRRHPDIISRQYMQKKYSNLKKAFTVISAFLISVFILAFYWLNRQKNQTLQFKTSNNHIASVKLFDHSELTINGNSVVDVRSSSIFNPHRSITVDGEAFFNVKEKLFLGRRQSFEVNSSLVKISVLGTSFNVNTKDSVTQIYLQEGKIILSNVYDNSIMTLEPGDYVWIDKHNKSIKKKRIVNNLPMAWVNQSINFELNPVVEILEYLSNTQKAVLNLQTKKIDKKTFTGKFPTSDLKILTKALEEAFDIEIKLDGQTLIVKDKK